MHRPRRFAILVVEDDSSIARGLSDLLVDFGYTALSALSARDAFVAVAHNSIDAALLDVHLGPDQRVFEVAEVLSALRKPFAFLSAHSRYLMPPKFKQQPHLEKPFSSSQVLALVADLLN